MGAATTDVAVVGGGPAGLAVAIACRARGLGVTVFERGAPGRDKACGEGLMPDGVAALERLGVDTGSLGRPFVGIRYHGAGLTVEGSFPGAPGRGIRRPELHRALADAAADAGATLRWNTRVEEVGEDGSVRWIGGAERASWIVGADGLLSRVRERVGRSRPGRHRRFGVRRHYRVVPWTERVEVHWAEGAEAYVTPVGDDRVGVAILWSGARLGFDGLLPRFPALASRLAGVPIASRDRGAGPFRHDVSRRSRGRIALVGDAAGYVDALTGEGLGIAFQEAETLAASVAAGDLAVYDRASRRLRRRPEQLTRLLLMAESRPWLRDRFLGALARRPELFDRLLALAAGEPAAAGPPLGLGWALLAGGLRRPGRRGR